MLYIKFILTLMCILLFIILYEMEEIGEEVQKELKMIGTRMLMRR